MQNTHPATAKRQRDPRLDFYRGIAMFIILAAHTPGNFFTSWIPARWGFSDATEIFVFCSGMASAIAFGTSYELRGWFIGTARVAYRVWQVYWAHICMFLVIAMLVAWWDQIGFSEKNYVNSLNLAPFFTGRTGSSTGIETVTADNLIGLMTLTYVPNYFDVLPMYIVILCLMPLMMALAQVHVALAFALSVFIWFFAQSRILEALGITAIDLHFNAEPWSNREWFFNPFGWQLIFFTGFAFVRGWLPRPPINVWFVLLALVIVIGNIPFSNIGSRYDMLQDVNGWRTENRIWITKSDFGILRYVHFLGFAYLGYAIAGDGGHRLLPQGRRGLSWLWKWTVTLITKVGQQSLAVFIFSMVLGRISGMLLDQTERTTAVVVSANFIGWALLICVAYTVAWFKSNPWKRPAAV
ncbi:OpgC domain-containing protein [bacterium]|nr:OpgC domain-containing protein [bacterium]